jgi:general secretion pathway protein F
MPAFNYTALTAQGRETKGVMEGDSARQIRQKLREQGMVPLEVAPLSQTGVTAKSATFSFSRKLRISVPDLAIATRQLATLISAGIPLEEALLGVAEQSDKDKVKSILIGVRAKVLEGHSLAHGLADFPQAFSPLYRATVAAGEQSGHLDVVLNRLADYTELQHQTQQKVQQALIYPVIMTLVSVLIVVFLLIYVVPKMVSVFSSTHQVLPLSTRTLIAISHTLHLYGLYILIGTVLLIFLFFRTLHRQLAFRLKVHRFLLKMPMIGSSIKTVNTARFSRTFGILNAASVPVLEAMRIASELITNIPIREAVDEATLKVREGSAIHRALKQTGYFPAMSIHLIASGEASGTLENMLERAASNQEREVQGLIDNTLRLFEPALILIMGSIVLYIVMAVMLPIFSLNQYNG